MDTAAFIDAISQHWLNKGEASVGDADTRARILFHAQTQLKMRWNKRPWWFKAARAEVDVRTSDGAGALPLDFSSFGREGFLTNPQQKGSRLTWLPQQRLNSLCERTTSTSRSPRFYTLFGQTGGDEQFNPNQWNVRIYLPPPDGDITLVAYYDRKAPTLADTDDSDPDAPSGLKLIPDDFVEPVLMNDVIARLMVDEGDARSLEFKQTADRADAELWAEHLQGRQQPRHSPRYGEGTFR